MKETIFVLSIAGSDSGGGAGIQADLKTFSALGVFGCTAVTAVTAQNTLGVRDIQAINPDVVSAQIDAVLQDFDVKAIKTGMIFTKENALAIKESLINNNYANSLILDPVMISTRGNNLITAECISAICEHLFPFADLITPNIDEAEALSDMTVENVEDMIRAAEKMRKKYALKDILIKGGHLKTNEITDVLLVGDEVLLNTIPKINSRNTHGTGCTLSSALAAYVAMGQDIKSAYANAKQYLTNAISTACDMNLGHGSGSVNHFF
ncbi:MAG: bifunctional hydroxymethylpyrimidine kinase/phosphomethylpyrimidine kinase [Bacteroidales bacterium]|nr:bifunctional hydroxymethylpyrimidine kinase/phosphomethylpyrimidine kinase [Bacteroidales bacterium]